MYKIPDEFLGGARKDLVSEDIRHMCSALVVSMGSEDPSTQVGACYVSSDGVLLSEGFNTALWEQESFPYGGDVKKMGIENTKYPYINHAEMKAVLNYKGSLTDFRGSTLYVTLRPCENCARFVSSLGVKRIVCLNERTYNEKDTTGVILDKCNIEYMNPKDNLKVRKIVFDFTANEKNNVQVLKLINDEKK